MSHIPRNLKYRPGAAGNAVDLRFELIDGVRFSKLLAKI